MLTMTASGLYVARDTTNEHHLWFVRPDYKGIEAEFRNLPCAIDPDIDVLVHRCIHAEYLRAGVLPRKPLFRDMKEFILRHRTFTCSCRRNEFVRRTPYNILQLGERSPLYQLPCMWSWIDPRARKLLVRAHHGLPRLRISMRWQDSLLHRHEQGDCRCGEQALELTG